MNFSPKPKIFNRELSWLKFNERVLLQAADQSLPILERLRFIIIFSSNLDEFYMKRIGGLKRQIQAGIDVSSPDGLLPKEQVQVIREALNPLLDFQDSLFAEELKPELLRSGIELLSFNELSNLEQEHANTYFQRCIFPQLTPMAVDAGKPFPLLSNLSTSLAVLLKSPEQEEPQFARIKISNISPQWIKINQDLDSYRYIALKDLISNNLSWLFPHLKIEACLPFRITRNSKLELDSSNEDADDLLEMLEEELKQQKFAKVVRLEHGQSLDRWLLNFLKSNLDLEEIDIFERKYELDYSDLSVLLTLPSVNKSGKSLKLNTWKPQIPPALLESENIFDIIKQQDILLHHPYFSFKASVERFLREAVDDPEVLGIKMTLYRIGDNSPLIPLLIRAAEWGKHVVCIVELTARFDEERNLQWAATLEESGVHVLYGIPGLKIHAKAILVTRKEGEEVSLYAHVGTGNYHAKNALEYTDLGLLTKKAEIVNELTYFFNYLTGRSLKSDYQNILVSPVNLEKRLLEDLHNEILIAQTGGNARIIAKMNGLEDRHMIEALYQAAAEGVEIDLIVRGICCLIPDHKNIRVRSIIGRFLEHSRIFYFQNNAQDPVDGKFYIGSADWMERNLHRRVELAVPLLDFSNRKECWKILNALLSDLDLAWTLGADGSYGRVRNATKEEGANCIGCLEFPQVNDGTADFLTSSQDYLMSSALLEARAK